MDEIILLIDDDVDDIKNFEDHFREMQSEYQVISEQDFSKTLTTIKDIISGGNRVVAIFVDLIKKIGANRIESGFQTIATVREKYDDILIVAYTQYGADYAKEAQDRGADWFIQKQNLKNITYSDLKSKIDKKSKELNSEKTQYRDFHINVLLNILDNLHNSMSQITIPESRYHQRGKVFEINDEYDLQDLFWVVFKPIFPEMTKEVPMPKHMGQSSRADFYIPEIKTILELKYSKTNLQAKERLHYS